MVGRVGVLEIQVTFTATVFVRNQLQVSQSQRLTMNTHPLEHFKMLTNSKFGNEPKLLLDMMIK